MVIVHKNMLEIPMLNVYLTKMSVCQAHVEQMQFAKISLEDMIVNVKQVALEMPLMVAFVVDHSLTPVRMLVADLMLSVLLVEELLFVFALTTNQMEILWWSAPQRKVSSVFF